MSFYEFLRNRGARSWFHAAQKQMWKSETNRPNSKRDVASTESGSRLLGSAPAA